MTYFRKYQTLLDQQEDFIRLQMLMKNKSYFYQHTDKNLSDFHKKMKTRFETKLTEMEELKIEYYTRKKCLELKIKDRAVQKMFNEVFSMKEIILIELKHCEEAERDILGNLCKY